MSDARAAIATADGRPGAEPGATLDALAAVFRQATIGMAIGARDGRLLGVNPAYCRMLGYDRDELLAMDFAAIAYPNDPALSQVQAERLASGEITVDQREQCFVRKDGSALWGVVTVSALRDAEGHHLGMLAEFQDTTGGNEAATAPRDSGAQLETLLGHLPIALYDQEPGTSPRFRYVSPRFARVTGLVREDLLSGLASPHERVHPVDRPAVRAASLRAERTGEPIALEYRVSGGNGDWSWIAQRAALVRDEQGRPLVWKGLLLDVSERRQLDAVLRENQTRFRRAFEDAAIGMSIGSLDDVCLDANTAYCRIVGKTREELIGHVFAGFTHQDDVEAYTRLHTRLQAGEIDAYQMEKRYLRPDGTVVSGLLTVSAVRDESGVHLYDLGQLQDISEQKRLEAELRESEERFRRAFEDAGIGMSIAEPRGQLIDVNPALCRMLGYSREELRQMSFADITHPDDVSASLKQALRLARDEIDGYSLEKRYIRKDGEILWADLTVTAVQHAAGGPVRVIGQVQDITARKAAEAALRESEARFRSVFERAGIGMSLATPDREIVLANPALGRLLGYAPEELVGLRVDDLSFSVNPAQHEEHRQRLRAGEIDAYQSEKRYVRKDGSLISALVDVSSVRDEHDELIATIGQIQDVTAWKEAEAELRASEARFRALVQNDPDVIAVIDADWQVTYISPSAESAFGIPATELLGPVEARFQSIHPEEREKAIGLFARVGEQSGAAASLEARIWHEQRGWRWFQITVSNQLADHGIAGYVFNVRDITERKDAEAALRDSEARFRSIFEGAAIGMSLADLDGTLRMANPAFERLLGYAPGELNGIHTDDITLFDDVPIQIDHRRRLRTGEVDEYQLEKRYWRKDGQIVWVLLSASAVLDEKGVPQAVIGQVQDITARRGAEAALRESEARFRALVQNDPDVILVIREDMTMSYVSPSTMTAFGVPAEELLGPVPGNLEYIHPDDREQVSALFDMVNSQPGAVAAVEARFNHRELGWRWFLVTISNHLADPGIDGYLFNLRDITERKHAELATVAALETQQAAIAELEQLNRSKSRFLSTISHEFRTPLTAIIGYSELLASNAADPAQVAEDAAVIHREASRLNRMVDDVLVVDRLDANRMPLDATPVDLNTIVRNVAETFRPLTDKHHLALDLDPALPPIPGDADRLAQAVTNLISNAVKYSPTGGAVTIATRNDGDDVVLTVQDEGIGIARKDLPRIFERFERVESGIAGRISGTGLGLSIVREVATLHHGEVWAKSKFGVGSTFSLALPVRQPAGDSAAN
jgi:PAS domain S-box-containing protein